MTTAFDLSRLPYFLPALGWMIVIFALSSRETLPPPPGVSFSVAAIAGHFVIYFVLTVLITVGVSGNFRPGKRQIVVAAVASTLYGVSDEFHQSFVPGRSATVFDIAVNGAGSAIAGLAMLLHRRRWSPE